MIDAIEKVLFSSDISALNSSPMMMSARNIAENWEEIPKASNEEILLILLSLKNKVNPSSVRAIAIESGEDMSASERKAGDVTSIAAAVIECSNVFVFLAMKKNEAKEVIALSNGSITDAQKLPVNLVIH